MKTYNGIEIEGSDHYDCTVGRYFLIRVSHSLRRREYYRLQESPGRTNMSHAPLLHGWLGTTNDVARYAEGQVNVYRDTAGRLRIRAVPEDKESIGEET